MLSEIQLTADGDAVLAHGAVVRAKEGAAVAGEQVCSL